MLDDFIEIFKHSFHRFSLVGVKNLGKQVSDVGREYFKFVGKFEFEPPEYIFDTELEENKPYILQKFRTIESNSSNCFQRKFTKKLFFGKSIKKRIDFQYVFDIVPKNIVDFEFDESKRKIYLYVLGYGTF